MNKNMLSEMLKEMKSIRKENKKLMEKTMRINLEREEESRKEKEKDEKLGKYESIISEMQKKIFELEAKNRNLVEEMRKIKVSRNDLNIKKKLRYLSPLGVEIIVFYMDPNKRLLLSFAYEKFRKMEKKIPLRLEKLEMTDFSIAIDNTRYEFRHKDAKVEFSDPQYSIYSTKDGFLIRQVTHRQFHNWFEKRTNFHVETFQSSDNLLFLRERINVGTVLIDFKSMKHAHSYSKTVGHVKRLFISDFFYFSSFRETWVENVERLETLDFDRTDLMEALQNIRAPAIYVYFYDILECIEVIREWLETKTRKVGSQLFLIINLKNEDATIDEILDSNELAQFGFYAVDLKTRRKRILQNNSEVMLTVREDREHFSQEFLENSEFRRYLCLEIIESIFLNKF